MLLKYLVFYEMKNTENIETYATRPGPDRSRVAAAFLLGRSITSTTARRIYILDVYCGIGLLHLPSNY